MKKFMDLTGKSFERLEVIARAKNPYGNSNTVWLCRCTCGSELIVSGSNLRSGNSKSCGCLKIESAVRSHTKHSGYGSRLYRTWSGIKTRCSNENRDDYRNYGGRGITICEEWSDSFEKFREWSIANGYDETLTIDRKDNNGNYEPDNCQWVTFTVNCNNKRNNHLGTAFGEIKTLAQWSKDERCVVGYNTLRDRIGTCGWDTERALTTLKKIK